MHVSTVYQLRQALGLDQPGTPVKVMDPFQLLGEIKADLLDALGIDCVNLKTLSNRFGFKNEGWKPWTLFDGTPLLVPGEFNTEPEPNGDILQYPQGDRSAPASGRMPKDGFYFDAIIRQAPIDDSHLDPADNLEEFAPLTDQDVQDFVHRADCAAASDCGVIMSLPGTGLGDIAMVPAPFLKHPKGIRDVQEWYISTLLRKDYLHAVFERQTEIAVGNIQRLAAAVGERVGAVFVCGTDFGTQRAPFLSPEHYRELYSPYYRRINRAIHECSSWKTFKHTCGSVYRLLPDLIADGFDILNPVQCSAAEMDAERLKKEFGDALVFWGGGVNTQQTLPYGTPEEVYWEARQRIDVFNDNGGFVFTPVHNIQAPTPVENIDAMFRAIRDSAKA
jgi:hypothetical protein